MGLLPPAPKAGASAISPPRQNHVDCVNDGAKGQGTSTYTIRLFVVLGAESKSPPHHFTLRNPICLHLHAATPHLLQYNHKAVYNRIENPLKLTQYNSDAIFIIGQFIHSRRVASTF
jgi:hypothetical protein